MALPRNESGAPRKAESVLKNARLAAVQMVSTPRVEENLRSAGALISEAVAQGADLVALPEYFPIMGASDGDKLRAREADGAGPIQSFLAETARRHGIWLVGGSLPLIAGAPGAGGKAFNSCLVYNPQGERVARYDKIHLFGFEKGGERYNESAMVAAGSQPAVCSTPFGRVGLSICYDIRFPELYRGLGVVDLMVIPAAFTETTGRAHWEILLRARHRKPVLRAGQRAGRPPRKRPRNARQQPADRSLGRDSRPPAERPRHRHRRA